MEKKTCKFSITQFEFELEAYQEEVESGKDKRKWENTEVEYLKKNYGVLDNKDLSKALKRSPRSIEEKRWQIKPEQEPAVALLANVPENIIEEFPIAQSTEEPETGKKQRRKRKQEAALEPETGKKQRRKRKQEQETEKVETEIKPIKKLRGKRGEAWQRNLEMYQQGEKSNTINSWMAQNRKGYKTGKLSEKKLDKLLEIIFLLKLLVEKNDSWSRQLED